jgi:hypothetical protein
MIELLKRGYLSYIDLRLQPKKKKFYFDVQSHIDDGVVSSEELVLSRPTLIAQ